MTALLIAAVISAPLLFGGAVVAQTLTPGELNATSVVGQAQVRADATRRKLDAPTATPVPTRTPTNTPEPTYTPPPTNAPVAATAIPTLNPTPNIVAITQAAPVVVVDPRTEQLMNNLKWGGLAFVGLLLLAGFVYGLYVIMRKMGY